jgi:hypothetical protein
MSIISQFTTVKYIFSLMDDSLTGPYSTNINIPLGTAINLRLVQMTAGPLSNLTVSFGDGSPDQAFYSIVVNTSLNLTYNYTTSGVYKIAATAVTTCLANVTYSFTVDPMTVNVINSDFYPSKFSCFIFHFFFKLLNKGWRIKNGADFSEKFTLNLMF